MRSHFAQTQAIREARAAGRAAPVAPDAVFWGKDASPLLHIAACWLRLHHGVSGRSSAPKSAEDQCWKHRPSTCLSRTTTPTGAAMYDQVSHADRGSAHIPRNRPAVTFPAVTA